VNREVLVHLDDRVVGRLWARARKGRESATFEYAREWLIGPERFELEPSLALGSGPQHTPVGKPLFGCLGDSAPDRWGRMLMRRAERRQAETEGRTVRSLLEVDYLLRVDDEARQGALRFRDTPEGPFLGAAGVSRIPPLVELPRLLAASDRVVGDRETDEDLRLLLAPGSSLGGARPKASLRDLDGSLALAKFPAHVDETSVVQWEAVALTLAGLCGIQVPDWKLVEVLGRQVLVSRRFDRAATGRLPFISALTMLGATDNEMRSYLEIADSLHQHGASPTEDVRSLWRRLVFNVLISNTDDHLRNLGFLRLRGPGWRLAPAYDLNPVPLEFKPRILCTAIDEDDPTASLALALSVAEHFRLTPGQARETARQVASHTQTWRQVARSLAIPAREVERMRSAFEHGDLAAALEL